MSADALTTVAAESRAVLGAHGKSFRLAGHLLPSALLDDAAVLYAFCRLADDEVDEAADALAARESVTRIRAELGGTSPARPLLRAFLDMARRRSVPLYAAQHLLDGVTSDLDPVRLPDEAALVRYAYRVAGTVGLMMCGVLGATSADAHPHAIDLGVGMQLSNIARDVEADRQMGRVYLPATWLADENLRPEDVLAGTADPTRLVRVVHRLLDLAERYYASADAGLPYLPLRARWTVLAAGRLYRGIGLKVRARGVAALRDRTVVSAVGKAGWLMVATATLAAPRTWPGRRLPHDTTLHVPLRGMLTTEGTCTG